MMTCLEREERSEKPVGNGREKRSVALFVSL